MERHGWRRSTRKGGARRSCAIAWGPNPTAPSTWRLARYCAPRSSGGPRTATSSCSSSITSPSISGRSISCAANWSVSTPRSAPASRSRFLPWRNSRTTYGGRPPRQRRPRLSAPGTIGANGCRVSSHRSSSPSIARGLPCRHTGAPPIRRGWIRRSRQACAPWRSLKARPCTRWSWQPSKCCSRATPARRMFRWVPRWSGEAVPSWTRSSDT